MSISPLAIYNRWVRKEDTMEIIITVLALIILDIAALRWGTDSRDGINSEEWKRRQEWSAHH
jgi:hypothetical protein